MNTKLPRYILLFICAILFVPNNLPLSAQQAPASADQSVRIPSDQLDALVAPIALYPDELLAQTLVASTYPLEIMQLQQWLGRNSGLKDKALVDAVSKQPWDPSIQAMAALPQVVKRLADDIQWTTDLGNAFLAQQSDVMNAVQRMRVKAQGTGALTSNAQQTVETQVIQDKTVVVVEQAQPDVVYVPEYNPVAVYGEPVYPYPAIYYPSYTPGAVFAASAISWGVGVAMGAAWGGGWGWGAGWGGNDIDMNFNNSFNRNNNFNRDQINALSNRTGAAGNRSWQHNPQHRGGTPYADRRTADRFGSNTRGDSLTSRQKGAQQAISRQKGNLGSVGRGGVGDRQGPGGLGDRGGVGSRPGGGNIGDRGGNIGSRPGGGNIGSRPGGGNIGGAGVGNRGNIGGGDRVGNRSVGGGGFDRSGMNRGGFGGSGGFDGRSARSSSSRGSSSMRSSGRSGGGFGGGGRSGGGRGGGGRGGGGRGGGRR